MKSNLFNIRDKVWFIRDHNVHSFTVENIELIVMNDTILYSGDDINHVTKEVLNHRENELYPSETEALKELKERFESRISNIDKRIAMIMENSISQPIEM